MENQVLLASGHQGRQIQALSVPCAVLQGHLQEESEDEARSLGGLKWKLRKPGCIREHKGTLFLPSTMAWLKVIQLSLSPLRTL